MMINAKNEQKLANSNDSYITKQEVCMGES